MKSHKKQLTQLDIKPANSKMQMLRRRPSSAAKNKTYIHTRSGTFKICSPTGEGREQALLNLRKMFTKDYMDISPASTTSAQSGIRKSFSPRTNPPGSPVCESPKDSQLNVISMSRIKIIHVRSRTQIPCYTINAYPLYQSLKTIKKQDQISNDDFNSIPQLVTGNEVNLNKIKRNPSSESILKLNSKNPESVSSKCLDLDKKKRAINRRKWKSDAMHINYLNDSSDNQTMKYEKEVISIWNNTNNQGIENNNGIKLTQETLNESQNYYKNHIPKFSSVSSLNCNFNQKSIEMMEKTPQTKRILGFSQWRQSDSDEETEKSLNLKPIIFKITQKSIPESADLSESSNAKYENNSKNLITTESRPQSSSSYSIDVPISKKILPSPHSFKKLI